MHPLVIIVFLPIVAALIAGLGGPWIGKTAAKVVTTGALFIGALLSWPIFFQYINGSAGPVVVPVMTWIQSGSLTVDWALRLDSLTAVMLVVVTTVSSLVHLYSWGYMEEDPGQPRFFAYLSLFSFAMLMLVTADSLVQMFFGWEGVGLASYLLIGFWYHKPSANAAALKAFVVNRIGDFGFSLGIFGTFLVFGTVSIPAILAAAPGMAGSTIGFAGMRVDTMTLLCLLLFVGAMGKSAQIGLHTWLPDAMEGPTPVSALIHAATMVTAGVFMVCRLSPMFNTSPVAMHVVTFVGAEGLGFAGFWSKDAILESAWTSGSVAGTIGFWLGSLAAILTSFYSWRLIFLTFYGEPRWAASEHIQHATHHVRESPDEEHGDSAHDAGLPPSGTGGYRPHESPLNMLVPIGLLAVGAVFAGQIFHAIFIDPERAPAFWRGSVAFTSRLSEAAEHSDVWVRWSPTIEMLIGLWIAWRNYIAKPGAAAHFVETFPAVYKFVSNKWYFDELYDFLFVRPALWLGRLFWHGGDEGTIDRFGPHGAAYAVGIGNRVTARLQSGYLYSYAFVMLLGLIGAATWAIWWAR